MVSVARHNAYAADEIEYLKEKWGYVTLKAISIALKRSETGIVVKAKRLGLGSPYNEGKYLTAHKVALLMGVDTHAITDYWVAKCGLTASRKRMRNRKMCLIEFDALVKWLKRNQDKWDSRRVELYALGMEYPWLVEKRAKDRLLPRLRAQKWTVQEDHRLMMLFRKGFTYKEIGVELERSACAVQHRVSRIDVWGTGKYKEGVD